MKKIISILVLTLLVSASCNLVGTGVLGVLKTIDGGGSWQGADRIENSKADISGLAVTEMALDPNDRQTVYLSTTDNGVWISNNAAQTWKQILSKITAYDFYVDPSNSKRIFVSGVYNGHGKILRTQDGGASWEELYNEASSNNAVNSITANPANSNEIYAGLNSGVLIKSVDGGVNWFVLQEFKEQLLKIRYNRLNSGLYVLLKTKGLFKSTDGGLHFNSISNALSHTDYLNGDQLLPEEQIGFVKLGLDDQTSGVIYLTTLKGLYKTTNDGVSWNYLNIPVKSSAELPRAVASTRGGAIAYTSIGSTIYKTLDGGQSWQTQTLPANNIVNKILIDPALPQITYIGLTK